MPTEVRTITALWRLLDDIDTLDDACKSDDAVFRKRAYEVQRKRFDILSGEEFDRLDSAPAPASGGVDAAFTVASNLLRDGCTYADRKAAADFIRSALSPAATPEGALCEDEGCPHHGRPHICTPVTAEMVTAAMRAFEPLSTVLRYREKDGWHACDQMAMRAAIEAALAAKTEKSNGCA